MLHKLLTLVGLGVPCATGLPTVIYVTSTSSRWKDMWVPRFEDSGHLLHCVSEDSEKYDIVLKNWWPENRRAGLDFFVNGESMEIVGEVGLKWNKEDRKNTLVNNLNSRAEMVEAEIASCNKIGNWDITEDRRLEKEYWRGSLLTLSAYLQINTDNQCQKNLFTVRCSVQVDGENIGTTGGTSSIKIAGKLPSLVFTPF